MFCIFRIFCIFCIFLCFFSDLFSVCVANVPASNFIYQNCDVFYVFFQICFPCVLRASLRATLYTKTAICSAPLATKKCRYSGAFRATCSTKTAMFRCFASNFQYQYCDCQVPCERPCWAVPCTILTLCARSLFLFSSKNRRALYYSHTGTRY